MKLQSSFATVLLIALCYTGYTQINDFNLSDYKLPELKRQALETYFNVYGQDGYREYPQHYGAGSDNSSDKGYYGNLSMNYTYYQTNSTVQRELYSNINCNSSYSDQKQNKKLSYDALQIAPTTYNSLVNRNYFSSKKFLETDLNFRVDYQYLDNSYRSYSGSSYDTYTMGKRNDKTFVFVGYLPLKIGFGRIEQIQDARHAIYIYDELLKQERVNANIGNGDVLKLANHISDLKNKRFFDSRIRRMYEIESVDSFLNTNNYIRNTDARYFTTLTDFWDYGDGPVRYSGTRLSFGLYPGYYYKNFYENDNNDSFSQFSVEFKIKTLLLHGGFDFVHEKPISLKWQNSIEMNAFLGIIKGELNQFEDVKIDIPNIQLYYKQGIGFYPNTRTQMTWSYSINYIKLFGDKDENYYNIWVNGQSLKAASELSVNYYISPKLRLSLYSSVYYIWTDSEYNANLTFNNLLLNNNNIVTFDSFASNFNMSYLRELQNIFQFRITYSIF